MAEKLSAAVVIFFRVVEVLILLRFVLTFIPLRGADKLFRFIHTVTEPILSPVRKMIERSSFGKNLMFDFSMILAYVLLGFAEYIILLLIAKL